MQKGDSIESGFPSSSGGKIAQPPASRSLIWASYFVAGVGEISNFDLVKDLAEVVNYFTEAIY